MNEIKIVAQFIEMLREKSYGHPGNLHVDWKDIESAYIEFTNNKLSVLEGKNQ